MNSSGPTAVDGSRSLLVAGADAAPGGWVVATVSDPRSSTPVVRWSLVPDASALVGLLLAPGVVRAAVDLPIGLPEQGRRPADVAARARLPGAAATVFAAPSRALVDAWRAGADHAGAVRLARAQRETAPSRQAWNLVPRIADLDDVLAPADQQRLTEAHPELSLRTLDPRVRTTKHQVAGLGERVRALGSWLDVGTALSDVPTGTRGHDALDALACAWTAGRWAVGTVEVLGDETWQDARGLTALIRV